MPCQASMSLLARQHLLAQVHPRLDSGISRRLETALQNILLPTCKVLESIPVPLPSPSSRISSSPVTTPLHSTLLAASRIIAVVSAVKPISRVSLLRLRLISPYKQRSSRPMISTSMTRYTPGLLTVAQARSDPVSSCHRWTTKIAQ